VGWCGIRASTGGLSPTVHAADIVSAQSADTTSTLEVTNLG
jgi:hypothetical protein